MSTEARASLGLRVEPPQDGVFDGANTVLNAVKNGVLYVNAIYL